LLLVLLTCGAVTGPVTAAAIAVLVPNGFAAFVSVRLSSSARSLASASFYLGDLIADMLGGVVTTLALAITGEGTRTLAAIGFNRAMLRALKA
jgi:hypothetical protein